jgi:uncharacterized phage protein (TIGR02216 family)
MTTGLGRLGLSPRDFWAMTPREFDAAVRGHLGLGPSAAPLASHDLASLMARFPDQPT